MPRVKPKRLLHYSRTCAYYLQYHIIFCTKYRRKVLTEPVMKDLIDALKRYAENDPNWNIIEINGEADHIHMLIDADVNLNVPSLMKKLKGPSARELFRTHPEIKKRLYGGHLWSPSYFIATVSDNTAAQVKEYIQHQGEEK